MNIETDLPTIRRLIDTNFYVFKAEIKKSDGSEYAIIHTNKGAYKTHLRFWIEFFKNNDIDSSVEYRYNMNIDEKKHRTEVERKAIKCWFKGGYIRTKDKNGNCASWHAIIEKDDIVWIIIKPDDSCLELKCSFESAIDMLKNHDIIEFVSENGEVEKYNNNEYENWTSLWSERGELCYFYKDTDKDKKNPTIYFIHDEDVRDKINSKSVVSTDDMLKLINDSHDYYTKEIRVLVRIVSDEVKI